MISSPFKHDLLCRDDFRPGKGLGRSLYVILFVYLSAEWFARNGFTCLEEKLSNYWRQLDRFRILFLRFLVGTSWDYCGRTANHQYCVVRFRLVILALSIEEVPEVIQRLEHLKTLESKLHAVELLKEFGKCGACWDALLFHHCSLDMLALAGHLFLLAFSALIVLALRIRLLKMRWRIDLPLTCVTDQ